TLTAKYGSSVRVGDFQAWKAPASAQRDAQAIWSSDAFAGIQTPAATAALNTSVVLCRRKAGSVPHKAILAGIFRTLAGKWSLCAVDAAGNVSHWTPTHLRSSRRASTADIQAAKAVFLGWYNKEKDKRSRKEEKG